MAPQTTIKAELAAAITQTNVLLSEVESAIVAADRRISQMSRIVRALWLIESDEKSRRALSPEWTRNTLRAATEAQSLCQRAVYSANTLRAERDALTVQVKEWRARIA